MTLYATMFYDTDDYTYGCDIVLGVYSTKANADERALRDLQEHKKDLERYTIREFTVDTDWE